MSDAKMMDDYAISIVDGEPDAATAEGAEIVRILREYNRRQIPDTDFQRLTVVVRDGAGTVLGGCVGRTYWGWLEVQYLAVAPQLRRTGYGAKLLAAAEAEAVSRGCHSAFLDTFSFQARPFYEKQGYRVFGALDNFPPGESRYFLVKEL